MQDFQWLHLVYLLGVMILVGPAFFYAIRNRSQALKNVAIWLAIAVAVAALYMVFGWR